MRGVGLGKVSNCDGILERGFGVGVFRIVELLFVILLEDCLGDRFGVVFILVIDIIVIFFLLFGWFWFGIFFVFFAGFRYIWFNVFVLFFFRFFFLGGSGGVLFWFFIVGIDILELIFIILYGFVKGFNVVFT